MKSNIFEIQKVVEKYYYETGGNLVSHGMKKRFLTDGENCIECPGWQETTETGRIFECQMFTGTLLTKLIY